MSSEIHSAYQPFFRDFPEPEKARARERLARNFHILSVQMGSKEFLVTDDLTIADCYLFWVSMVAPKSGVDLPANLGIAYETMKSRPSVIRALAEEGLG